MKYLLYINAADSCVIPTVAFRCLSLSSLSPLKLYQYMACEKPVIASKMVGLDILKEINSVLLVESEDGQEFAQAIITLLRNKILK